MKTIISKFSILTIAIFLTSCASSYRSINPPSTNYSSHDLQDGISISYQYDVLRSVGNKKYAKKEQKRGVRLIAIKVTNNTDSTINIGRDVTFYSGQNEILPMQPFATKEALKQQPALYLLYLLTTPAKLYVTKTNSNGTGTETETYPIGYVMGPGLTVGNMAMASSSNNKMLNELITYDILNKDVKKGETIYGLIGIRSYGYNPISLKLTK